MSFWIFMITFSHMHIVYFDRFCCYSIYMNMHLWYLRIVHYHSTPSLQAPACVPQSSWRLRRKSRRSCDLPFRRHRSAHHLVPAKSLTNSDTATVVPCTLQSRPKLFSTSCCNDVVAIAIVLLSKFWIDYILHMYIIRSHLFLVRWHQGLL